MVLDSSSGPISISADTVAALKIRFRAVDVESELLKAHLWLLRNPRRRPVRIWVFIDRWLAKAPATIKPATVVNAWWTTDERTINQGAAIGLNARPGESMANYRTRIADAMKAAA